MWGGVYRRVGRKGGVRRDCVLAVTALGLDAKIRYHVGLCPVERVSRLRRERGRRRFSPRSAYNACPWRFPALLQRENRPCLVHGGGI